MESSFDFDPEVLDNLYVHQLQQLKECTLKLDDTQDINLCRKWLQVLNKTSENEKVSRNCLCVLLCQQLKQEGHLSMPFTDVSNCNRDLSKVLASLDKSCSENSVLSSSREIVSCPTDYKFQSQENEIVRLNQELMEMRNQLDKKEAKIQELNEIIHKCNQCSMDHDIIEHISRILENFKIEKDLEKLFIFCNLFTEENNLHLDQKLIELDKKFQNILHEMQTAQVLLTQKQLIKVMKSKEKRLKNYEQQIHCQRWQYKLKTKVAKLKFYSILSQIFLKSRHKSQTQFVEMLDSLENRYKDIILKFSEGLPCDMSSW